MVFCNWIHLSTPLSSVILFFSTYGRSQIYSRFEIYDKNDITNEEKELTIRIIIKYRHMTSQPPLTPTKHIYSKTIPDHTLPPSPDFVFARKKSNIGLEWHAVLLTIILESAIIYKQPMMWILTWIGRNFFSMLTYQLQPVNKYYCSLLKQEKISSIACRRFILVLHSWTF